MIQIDIPGYKTLRIKYLVLDVNGTLACDGKLVPGVKERIDQLRTFSSNIETLNRMDFY